MALLKLICNTGAKIFVDQEFVSELQEDKLYITELSAGMYLVDVVSLIDDQIKVSFELRFDNDSQQILKRIDLAGEEKKCKQNELKSELMRNPNLSFYRNLARFEYIGLWGYVDCNYEIVVEPIYSSAEDFVNDFALVGKSFSEGIKYALIDTTGKNRMGVWFDELIFRDEKRLFVRRNNNLLSYDVLKGTLFTYSLSGEIKDDDLIPVLWENNYSKKGGYINLRGEVVLPFIYDQVSNFNEDGFAEVERFGYKRYITKEGQVCIYNTIYEIKSNHYYDHGDCLYLLDKQFDWCGPLESSHKDSLFQHPMRLAIKKGDKWGYYTFYMNKGKNYLGKLVPCEYDSILSDSRFNFVLLRKDRRICMVNLSDAKYKGGKKDGQYVYGEIGKILFDIEAEEVYPIIEQERHMIISVFVDDGYNLSRFIINRLVIKQKGKYGIIDKQSKGQILPCEYDDIFCEGRDRIKSHEFYSHEYLIIEKNGEKELINNQGVIITDLHATDIFRVNYKWWAVSLDSDQVNYHLFSLDDGMMKDSFNRIDLVSDLTHLMRPDDYYIKVTKNEKCGIIHNNGIMIINCEYDKIDEIWCKDMIYGFSLKSESGWGFYSLRSYSGLSKNSIILDCVYDSIRVLDDGLSAYSLANVLVVERKGKKAIFVNDRFITDFNYEDFTWEAISLYGFYDYDTYKDYEANDFIDESGNYCNLFTVDDLKYFVYVLCLDNKKYGLIKEYGSIILNCIYDELEVKNVIFEDGMFEVKVKKDGKEYIEKCYLPVYEE